MPGLWIDGSPTGTPNTNLKLAQDGTPAGQLSGAAVDMHAALNCGVDNVWIYNGNVNGILIDGTENLDAHANGPITQSFQQTTGTDTTPNNLIVFVKNFVPTNPFGTPSSTNVPWMHASVTKCRIDMNFPVWLAGTASQVPTGGLPAGGSPGQLPIRCVGAAGILFAQNRIGQRNQPSNFASFPPPGTLHNFPDVPPNTNDGMDCPGAWHILIHGNLLTNCGDGVGSEGNGDMVVSNNLMYNIGSIGIDLPANTGKTASQTVITGNTIFLSSDSGPDQQAINYQDSTSVASGGSFGAGKSNEQATAQQGSVIIADNLVYGPGSNFMVVLQGWGMLVRANIFDFGGLTPFEQPLAVNDGYMHGSFIWPPATGTGIKVQGNDIVIEGNLFRNAGTAGVPNTSVTGILFPGTGFPPPLASGDTLRVLIKGNIFDATIGVPILNSAAASALKGVRILDNIGANPPAALSTTLITPFPATGATFANPYPYDCFVTVITAAGSPVTAVALNGVTTNATIAANNQKSFLVKAGGTIAVTYGAGLAPTWTWVGL